MLQFRHNLASIVVVPGSAHIPAKQEMKENVKTGKSFGIECIRAIGEVHEENLPPGSPIQNSDEIQAQYRKWPRFHLGSQILGSVIFMDNHHLKLILHRTIYVVWLTNDDHLLQKVKGNLDGC